MRMTCRKAHDDHHHRWFTSSFSAGGQCVEVQFGRDRTLIRDSKYRRIATNDPASQPVIDVAAEDWAAFCRGLTDPSAGPSSLKAAPDIDGNHRLAASDGTTLVFTDGEWTAFVAGVQGGEFAHPDLVGAAR